MVFLYLFLGIACLWDYSYRRIPNFLQMTVFGFGILNSYMQGSWISVVRYLLTVFFVVAGLYVFFKLGMIGGGDVKLMAISSGFFEGRKALLYVFFCFVAGAVFAIIKMVADKNIHERGRYLWRYLKNSSEDLLRRRAGPSLYIRDREAKIKSGIAMSGPMLISALLFWGGAY